MIRIAQSEDCMELAQVHVSAWQQAYSDLLPQMYLSELDPRARSEDWREGLSGGDVTVFLDYEETTLIGFSACSSSRDADAVPACAELGALYYLRPYWGTGRAPVLYEKSRSHLIDCGYSTVTLWVLAGNARAITFYRKLGFDFDGKEKLEQRPGFTMKELRMTSELS